MPLILTTAALATSDGKPLGTAWEDRHRTGPSRVTSGGRQGSLSPSFGTDAFLRSSLVWLEKNGFMFKTRFKLLATASYDLDSDN